MQVVTRRSTIWTWMAGGMLMLLFAFVFSYFYIRMINREESAI